MRTWKAAERALRRETGLTVGRLRDSHPIPLVIAAGGARPRAVVALGGVDPHDPMDTVGDLACFAAALAPSRVIVALSVTRSPRARRGMLLCCDVRAVADGLVEVTRAWPWYRLGRHVWWPRVEVRQWESPMDLLPGIAAAILKRRDRDHSDELVERMLAYTLATGHRVRLAR
ncbi:MAG TPA: hypothetical protein VNU01_11945 [Egibacteraceae bacterium]|nr:hypothetical protein [Egibacteraceae bacterium]